MLPANHTDSPDRESLLDRAAELCGIEPEYWDTWGQRHTPAKEIKLAIVESLAGDCTETAGLRHYLAARELEQWTRLIPPSLILAANRQPFTIAVRYPAGIDWQSATVEIKGETGGGETWTCPRLPPGEPVEVQGQRFAEAAIALPRPLALGYYDLTVSIPGHRATTRLAVTPDRSWLPPALENGGRTAGLAVSLFGVRSGRNWGCGDATDLEAMLNWLHEDLGCSFLALNPLHAIDNRQPYNISPYLPNSIFFRNPIYIDVDRVPEAIGSAAAQRLRRRVEPRIEELRQSEFVQYERIWRLKRLFLTIAYREFRRTHLARSTDRARRFLRFVEARGERLDRFATYCALWDRIHRSNREIWIWQDWPAHYQDPNHPEVAAFRRKHERRVLFHAWLQWLIDEQLEAAQAKARGMGITIGLYHDLALATDRCGADLWAYRDFYVPGCRVGSPPDGFAPEGQDWAFPPPDTLRHRDDGYRLFIDSIRASARHGGALRMDHVMRLFRLYWIPEGMPAKKGAYVTDFHENLLRILALESVRGQFLVVGEDLGTVGGHVRALLEQYAVLSYKVLFFEKDQDGSFLPPDRYPRQALVSSTTHDLPTLAGYWTNRDIEARRQAGLLPDEASYFRQLNERAADKQRLLDVMHAQNLLPEGFPRDHQQVPELTGELHNAVIGFLVNTPTMLLVINQEDLTKETEQQNLPASTHEYPNWRRKMKYTVEQLRTLPIAQDFSAMFRNWLIKAGRK